MTQPLFLIGPRGCGKTTVGMALADSLNRRFVDTDQWLQSQLNMTVAEIVEREEWAGFRARETAALEAVTAPSTVIATGGGIILTEFNAALPARLSGQKVVYGCMQGTGVIFRDTVTVSGCLLLRPLRLPAAWRHPVVRPDSDRQLLAHPPVSAEPAGAVSGCRYGPMRENPACSDRSGRAAPVAP